MEHWQAIAWRRSGVGILGVASAILVLAVLGYSLFNGYTVL